jgi:hypothetical protein
MGKTLIRWPAIAAALTAVLALGACSRSAPPEAALPAQPVASQPAQPPLAGGPELADAAGAPGDARILVPARPVEEAPAPPLQRVAYAHVVHRHLSLAEERRARQLEIERRDYFAYRRYLAEQRLHRDHASHERHWYYRNHRLVFEHPERSRPFHRYGAPRYGADRYGAARHGAPRYSAPRYGGPYHRRPQWHAAPAHGAPGHHAIVAAQIGHPVHAVVASPAKPGAKVVAKPAARPAPAPTVKPAPHPAALIHPRHSHLVVEPVKRAAPQLAGPPPLAQTTLALPLISAPQPAPAITPAQAAAAPAVDLATQLGQLTTAVAEVMKGAKLDVPSDIAAGRQGKVVLTLPAELLQSARDKAAQVGLGASARKLLVTAKLAGQGYTITPNVDQSARLEAGEPTVFNWDVMPSATPGGVLTADMTGSLQGDGEDKTFALGAVTAQIPVAGQPAAAPAPIQAPVSAGAQFSLKLPDLSHIKLGSVHLPDLSRFHLRDLAVPGHPTVGVPGLGQVASYKVVAIAIVVLILILLMAISRSATARRERAERRRRFRSFEANHFGDEHP